MRRATGTSSKSSTFRCCLAPYRAKRDFKLSSEPSGGRVRRARQARFCVQKHDARRLHYDLRLEVDGVLKSWAVTRGPSLLPSDKRLAVETEDHPIEYLRWEGAIPKGQYGGGTMIVWDTGSWLPVGDVSAGLAKGDLEFELRGKRLKGRWHLVRMGYASFVKTTGGKGLHVVVPLTPKAGWDKAKAFSKGLATEMAKDAPERYVATVAKRARDGRIFIDYLRNQRGATAVSAFSMRARPGAPVSVPVSWDELPSLGSGRRFTVDNLSSRLVVVRRDPWAGFDEAARPLK